MKVEMVSHHGFLTGKEAWIPMSGASRFVRVSCGDEEVILEAHSEFWGHDRDVAQYIPKIRVVTKESSEFKENEENG